MTLRLALQTMHVTSITSAVESGVKSYCRAFPHELRSSAGAIITGSDGRRYLDMLAGCGSLNYGHNHPILKEALLSYIERDGLAMSLDFASESKRLYMEAFGRLILRPRSLDYHVQFTGPTGANAVEAAIKLARKRTGRSNVIAFTNAFHGCSLGALALTANEHHRASSSAFLGNVTRLPYDGYHGARVDTAELLERIIHDPSSGCDSPAAIVLEVIQGEGGLNAASDEWLIKVAHAAREAGALLIVDDIQAGCGRSGTFFSFEPSGIVPDMVILAKAVSGFGLPMSLVLIRPELDVWRPGEHNGTFRGNNHAFVTATAALEAFWSDDVLERSVRAASARMKTALDRLATQHDLLAKGRGFMQGLSMGSGEEAARVQSECFERGMIIETCGAYDEVLKLLPPLTATPEQLEMALTILEQALNCNRESTESLPSVDVPEQV